jgi:hypothetical protein
MKHFTEIPFKELINALRNNEEPLDRRYLNRLSDLDDRDLEELKVVWQTIPVERKERILQDINLIGEEEFYLSFISIGKLALDEDNPNIRLHGIRTLSNYENLDLIPFYIELVENDKDLQVREIAINSLSKYILFGEQDLLKEEIQEQIETFLLQLYKADPHDSIKRSSLEALGYSSRPEVQPLIKEAYQSKDKEWIASALFAMARSANNAWAPMVLEMLDNIHPVIRCEAARAAGELEISEAVPQLLQLIDDPDQETRNNSIWSLSQIGSNGIENIFEKLYDKAEDAQEIKFLENAMDNLEFTQETKSLSILDFSEDELEDFSGVDDLEDIDDLEGFDDLEDSDDLELSSEDDEDW